MAVIFHLDLDSFFVSAERLARPELRGKCVAVGGDGKRGVISTCSYEARKFGVRSAMPTVQAMRLCPQLILVPSDFKLYSRLSGQVFDILSRFTPIYEAVSIDEAYLDMTGSTSLFGTPREAAEKIRAVIFTETGLTASIGIASNRLVAKVTSDYCKPNGSHQVPEGTEAAFLAPFNVRAIPGIGKVSEQWLNKKGIFKVAELQRLAPATLEREFGKYGTYLFESAWGKGSTAFFEESKTRSMSREQTFENDEYDVQVLKRELWSMCAELGNSLRASEKDFARTVRLKLRYPPFETVSRSRVFPSPARLDSEIYEAVLELFLENWDGSRPIRLLGAGIVLGDGAHQLGLFEDRLENRVENERLEKIDALKDQMREKFGQNALKTGRDFE